MLDETQMKKTLETIEQDVKNNNVILYMKGDKLQPMCGFSARAIQILNSKEIEYETRNVLADEYVRQGIKDFANWPTIPQLYIKGEFVGGCDIITEMNESGELNTSLGI